MRELLKSTVKRAVSRLAGSNPTSREQAGPSFHDDDHLQAMADHLLQRATLFLETGTHLGETLRWVASRHQIPCRSCEPDADRAARADEHVAHLANAEVMAIDSHEFMQAIDTDPNVGSDALPVLWLDAHGFGFEWPLQDEVRWATSRFGHGHVLIDDFEVPGQPQFGFDEYEGQRCTWSFIREHIDERDDYTVVYPKYADLTSRFHPLRGWVLLSWGVDPELQELAATDRYTLTDLAGADRLG